MGSQSKLSTIGSVPRVQCSSFDIALTLVVVKPTFYSILWSLVFFLSFSHDGFSVLFHLQEKENYQKKILRPGLAQRLSYGYIIPPFPSITRPAFSGSAFREGCATVFSLPFPSHLWSTGPVPVRWGMCISQSFFSWCWLWTLQYDKWEQTKKVICSANNCLLLHFQQCRLFLDTSHQWHRLHCARGLHDDEHRAKHQLFLRLRAAVWW